MRKKWKFADIDRETAKMLAEECDADPFIALLCTARGYTEPEDYEEFVSLEPMFESPYDLPDMEKAVDCILAAVDDGKKICVFGDYDCDGVTATALLIKSLRGMGANAVYKIPDRLKEGYGLTSYAVEEMAADGVELIITVDNGINSVLAAVTAKEKGIKLVITDHHLPQDEIPEADAVIDPYLKTCNFEFKDIAGVGVAFRLASALEDIPPEELLYKYADLLTVGTVADVMPLVRENRAAVAVGINTIAQGTNSGLTALLKESSFDERELTASVIAFTVAPRLNAAGRLGNAARAVELLLSESVEDAEPLAHIICCENSRRQKLEQQIFDAAVNIIEENNYATDRVIVVCGENWHRGIVGISAAKLCERYARPVIVLSSDGETAVGSGRSLGDFNLFDAISSVSHLCDKFGGHALAAGLTLPVYAVDSLRREINDYAATVKMPFPELAIDCKLKPSALNFDLVDSIAVMEPFGNGNSVPVFAVCNVKIEKIIPLSAGKHIKIQFSKDYSAFLGIMFSVSPESFGFSVGDTVDVALTASSGYYKEERQLNLKIKDIRLSGTDDDFQFSTLSAYNDFLSDCVPSDLISLDRDSVGAVYRSLANSFICIDRIVSRTESTLGCGRVMAALDCLAELGLAEVETKGGIKYYRKPFAQNKTQLNDSKTYRILHND